MFTKRALYILFMVAGLGAPALAQSGWAPGFATKIGHASDAGRPHDPHHVVVKLRNGANAARALPPGARLIFDRWYEVPVAAGETPATALTRKAQEADIELVELNYLVGLPQRTALVEAIDAESLAGDKGLLSNDPGSAEQWNLALIGAPLAWPQTTGTGITVAVIDTGVSKGADLACHTFVHEYNAITRQAGPGRAADDDGHGTHVAGTIAQCTNNGLGMAGVAFGATLMPVKVLSANGGTEADIAHAIDWARAHGARVINLSLGYSCDGQGWPACSSSVGNAAIEAAAAADIVIVVSAGNDHDHAVGSPANHPDVIAVGSIDARGRRAPYSNFGAALDLVAPGGDVQRDDFPDGRPDGIRQETLLNPNYLDCIPSAPGFAYCLLQGTSQASPHVAGAVALLRSAFPQATRQQIQAALQVSALDLGTPGIDPVYGAGLVQIEEALFTLELAQATEQPPCLAGGDTLCLNSSRFAVRVDWRIASGLTGHGQVTHLTADTGYFWFFNPANVEVVVKVLDGCGNNAHYWVFASGLTNVETTITVTDTFTGLNREYFKPLGRPFTAVLDTGAFSGCL